MVVEFVWLPAHTVLYCIGMEGNEIAGKQAK